MQPLVLVASTCLAVGRRNFRRPVEFTTATGERWLQIFDRLERLVQAQDASAAAGEARLLLAEIDRSGSEMISAAFDDFLIDMLTLAFVAEAFGGATLEAARRLAQKRLSKIKVLSVVLHA